MNSRLTLQDLAGLLAEYTGKDKKATELFLKEFIAVLSQGVYADKIAKVKGLGTFKIISVDKRESIHVNTGERFVIPEHYKFSFLPDKELKELVNKPFSFFETTELNEDVNFLDLDESIDDGKESETEDESVEDLVPEEEIRTDVPTSEPIVADAAPVVSESESVLPEEPEPVPEVSHTEEDVTPQSTEVRLDLYTKKLMYLMIILIVFVLVGGVACLNRGFIRAYLQKDKLEVAKVQPVPVDTNMPVVSDTVETPEDTKTVLRPNLETDQEEKEPVVIDRIAIKSGDRLTMIAQNYYGHKLFWVYIYEYNKAKITNPNNVPIGTEIEIPAARLYDINAKDRASLDKAAAKQTEILTQNR